MKKKHSGPIVYSPSDLMRYLALILDRNRVNVAISRAQCLAVVVADPQIADTTPSSLDEMVLINLFCKLIGSFVFA